MTIKGQMKYTGALDMLVKIMLVVLLVFCSAADSMTLGQAKIVYNKLLKANGFKRAPALVLSRSSEVNAFYNGGSIIINRGMLNYVRNAAEVAMILGHELGHHVRHDHGSRPNREYASDLLGAKYMSRAGYNVCLGAKALYRLGSKSSDTHPSSISRYKRLGC